MPRTLVPHQWQLFGCALGVSIWAFLCAAPQQALVPEARAANESQSYDELASSATRAFKAGKFDVACKLYREASQRPSPSEAKATLLYNLGSCLAELRQYQKAETAFRAAAELSRELRPSALLAAGFAAVGHGDLEAAENDWLAVAPLELDYADGLRAEELAQRLAEERIDRARQALAAGERGAAREHLEVARTLGAENAALRNLTAKLKIQEPGGRDRETDTRPVPISLRDPGLAGWAGISGGYDSNASQTASTNRQNETLEQPIESGSATAFLSAEYTFRSSESTRVSGHYSGMYLGLTAPALENADLSIHEAGAGLRWLLTETVRASATLGATAVFEGLSSFFSYEAFARVALDKQMAPGATLGSLVEWKEVRGTQGRDYLSGHRVRVRASGRVSLGRASFALRADGRFNRVGALYLPVSLDQYGLVCPPGPCERTMVVPFSYNELRGVASARYSLRDDLAASARLELAAREYSQNAGLLGVAAGLKQRRDQRTQLGATVEYALDTAQRWGATANYEYVVNASNMKPDSASAAHRYDFSDRNYAQHIAELGLEVMF